jgi:hypothetical protein
MTVPTLVGPYSIATISTIHFEVSLPSNQRFANGFGMLAWGIEIVIAEHNLAAVCAPLV